MSQSRQTGRNASFQTPAAARRRLPWPVAVVLTVAVVAAVGFGWSKGRHADAPPVVVPGAAPAPVSVAAQPLPVFQKLKGRWQRPDGGYVIEIRNVDPGGKMDAAYFNPGPIHVAQAEASQEDGIVKVFIELRDVNYPGSTYALTYDSENDRLQGLYFQAVAGETYDVFFVKLKP